MSIARNTGYNILSQGLFVVLGLWAIPILLHGLGEEQFGLFALVSAVVGYFSLLDFGMSRANTKFLSEALTNNDKEQIPKIVWTSLTSTFFIGTVSALGIIFASPILVDNIFKLNVAIRSEAIRFFIIAGIGTPLMLTFGTLKGFQMALDRFDLVNIYQALTGTVQWVGSVVLLELGFGLEAIILLTVGSRAVLSLSAFSLLPRILPGIFHSIAFFDAPTLRKLWSFGGWVTISQIINPLFLYLDRFFIGTFLTIAAVAYYSVPQEAVTRMLVLAFSLTATLFPVMSGQAALVDKKNRIGELYDRSLKYLTVIMIPLILFFLFFAPEIIRLWLGEKFASGSTIIFQIFAVGLFFNSLAQIPLTLLHAFNRPDIPTKFLLVELLLTIALNILLIPIIGIIGAALVWSFRVTVDSFLLSKAARRLLQSFSIEQDVILTKNNLFYLISAGAILIPSIIFIHNSYLKIIESVLFAFMYMYLLWMKGFDGKDREFFLRLVSKTFKR